VYRPSDGKPRTCLAGPDENVLLDRVVQGEEIVITRHEQPVARMVPEGRPSRAQVGAAVEALFRLRERIAARTRRQKPLTAAEIKSPKMSRFKGQPKSAACRCC